MSLSGFDKQFDKTVGSVVRMDASLRARAQQTEKARLSLLHQVHEAQQRVLAAPLVSEVLEKVQKREHEKAVGVYEQLLGAFLSDVLPGERFIEMDLYTERGAPALDIYIKKGQDAPLEDAYLGTGGSVTNLLSTGLRLVALLRSGKRRFMVLDESDCWIEPALIPKYASIVQEMAQTLDVQILMISHHQENLFKDHIPYRLTMSKKSSLVGVDWTVSSDIPQWSADQQGIRFISLKHFQSHQHTIIPLAPTVTLLQGANDIGKSAVSNALRAVFEGDNNDTLIQHHKSSAKVSIDFGPEHLLSWERFRKGKVKVSYQLTDDQNQTIHASDGTKVPDWLIERFQIGKIDGLDVQIGQQQDPVFLLNQPPSQRAKALAIGQESGHVQAMILLDKQQVQEAKQTIKQGEKTLEYLRHEQDILQKMSDERMWHEEYSLLQEKKQHLEQVQQLLSKWRQAHLKAHILDVDFEDVALPMIQNTHLSLLNQWKTLRDKHEVLNVDLLDLQMPEQQAFMLKNLIHTWKNSQQRFEHLQSVKDLPDTLHALPTQDKRAIELYHKWYKAQTKEKILTIGDFAPVIPGLQHIEVSQVLHVWRNHQQQKQKLQQELLMIEQEHEILKNQLPTCPCCGREWEDEHIHTTDDK
mgnify:CR=1 FL=1